MHILLLANARSGTGRSMQQAQAISTHLARRGFAVQCCDIASLAHPRQNRFATQPHKLAEDFSNTLHARLSAADRAIIVGGDGTVHHLLTDLGASQTPIYHAGTGTENLFAREFGMAPDPEAVCAALYAGHIESVDIMLEATRERPDVPGISPAHDSRAQSKPLLSFPSSSFPSPARPIALMASFGPDAGVVHRLAAVRNRAAGHAMYLLPILQELRAPHLCPLTVHVDDTPLLTDQRGLLFVANSPQYACRTNPVRTADMRDGLLDVLFLPATNISQSLLWLARCYADALDESTHAISARGRSIRVQAREAIPWQCDGEAAGVLMPGEQLTIEMAPRALRVLLPA